MLVVIAAVIVLSAHSPGWAIVSDDGTHVNVSRRILRLAIPSPNLTRSDDGFINAYDTLVSDQVNRTIKQRLVRHFWSASFVLHLVPVCSHVTERTPDGHIKAGAGVDVEFSDGSKRRYNYDCSTQAYSPVSGTAQDSRMNSIPESPMMAANGGISTYGFTGSGASYDEGNLKKLLTHLNAEGNFAIATGNITCVWIPPKEPSLHCHANR